MHPFTSQITAESQASSESSVAVEIHRRISQETEDPGAQWLKNQIDFESQRKVNTATFTDDSGQEHAVVYSKPYWYVDNGRDYKQVDLVVVGKDGEDVQEVLDRYQEQVEASERFRKLAKDYVNHTIAPVLDNLPHIAAVVGRGDIYDAERVPNTDPNQPSDVDLLVFADPGIDVNAAFNEYVNQHPDTIIIYHEYKVGPNGYGGGEKVIFSTHATDDPLIISIDMLPLSEFQSLVELASANKIKKFFRPYVAHTLATGSEVILDKSDGRYQRFRTAALEKAAEAK